MALRNTIMIFFVATACLGVCSGASSSSPVHSGVVHKVGDSFGWSIFGDYKKWTATKQFHVGDVLLFAYDKEFHNLMEVNGEDYQSCNIKTPLALHAAGLDSILLINLGTITSSAVEISNPTGML
ncbi:mavicyanin-like [Argentina anserina]|uniref:mavicyanin-like n=1 Tax=Argentina anserina TaxID=57926 RepID=UPI00217640BD|nr:mavicyanin-like [Potentilla anserina]